MILVPSAIALLFVAFITYPTSCESLECYECSGLNDQQCTKTNSNCPMCMVYRNDNDPSKFDRRCCWWGCGSPNEITDYSGRPTYFCNSDNCNQQGSEAIFAYATTSSTTAIYPSATMTSTTYTSVTITTTTAAQQTSSQCYDCSGPDCGKEGSTLRMNCLTCMVYRNPNDQTQIERRCCWWWGCGFSHSIGTHNGVETYFCTGDKCNGYGAEFALGPPETTATMIPMTTTGTTFMTTASSTMITTATMTIGMSTTTQQTSFQCYDCSGSDCGREGSTLSMSCPTCMVYRNPTDQTTIERRCCWWGCGPSNSIGTHNGIQTYFCNGNKCNGYGAEFALGSPVTTTTMSTTGSGIMTTRTTFMTTRPSFMTTTPSTMVTTATMTIGMSTTTQQTSSQCYDCSGPDCGKEGSTLSMSCPTCMVYRNPTDQTTIERRCCWWGCGPSNSIGTHNGIQTYFCNGNKCNGYGAEFALGPPVTSTGSMMTTTGIMSSGFTTRTTSSSPICVLNCRNGGTPETEDGCFCYCLENTNGRECENVDCAQPDVDSETCSLENQSLCQESETFAFECHHLCGKC